MSRPALTERFDQPPKFQSAMYRHMPSAARKAEQQVEAVKAELIRRNPGFDGKETHKIEDGNQAVGQDTSSATSGDRSTAPTRDSIGQPPRSFQERMAIEW